MTPAQSPARLEISLFFFLYVLPNPLTFVLEIGKKKDEMI